MFGQFAENSTKKQNSNDIDLDLDDEIKNIVSPIKDNFILDTFCKNLEKKMNDDNQKEKESYDNSYMRVSKLTGNGCLRELYYDMTIGKDMRKKDLEVNKDNFQSYMRMLLGNHYHDLIQEILKDELIEVEVRAYDHEYKVTGKNDGIFKSKNAIFEIKTVGLSVFNDVVRNGIAKKHHVQQVQWYMKMFNLKKAILFYVNRNVDMFFGTFESFTAWENMQQIQKWRELNLDESIKIFEIDFNEEIMQDCIDVVNNLRKRIDIYDEMQKDNTIKEKPYPKTSAMYLCSNCKYLEICRN